MEQARVHIFTKDIGLQRIINILGSAINESCRKLECKRADHKHNPKLYLLPPQDEKK